MKAILINDNKQIIADLESAETDVTAIPQGFSVIDKAIYDTAVASAGSEAAAIAAFGLTDLREVE